MSIIVNARDVILQAYTPRVATVSMSANLVVSQSQVTGLGIVVAGTKMVFLLASTQVFQVAKSGTVSPSSTVLTANIKNLVNTPTLTVVTGTITPAPTLVGNTATIPYTNMLTDTALIRLTLVENSITYTDDITIVKVREGIDGLTGFLTNESHTVSADYLGNVLSYTDASGYFKVYQGINDITALCTFSIPAGGNTNALSATINATTGAYAVTGGYPTAVDSAVVLLRATFGSVTLDKVFTLAKTKAGTSGTNGVRGSRTFYVTLTGATATFSDTLATTTATVDGGPILNDIVTQYNTSQGFSQTKFYTGTGWIVVNAVVDGNLIVSGTIGATQMQTNIMNADNVLTRGLTVRDSSGTIILSSGTNLNWTKISGAGKAADNATVGATFGSNISGMITAANSTTFIDNLAVLDAQINTINATKINAGYISVDRLQAGTITASKLVAKTITAASGIIGDLAVDTLQIAGNAVSSQMFSASNGFERFVSGNITLSLEDTFSSLVINCSAGDQVRLEADYYMYILGTGITGFDHQPRLKFNGVVVQTKPLSGINSAAYPNAGVGRLSAVATAVAGANTVDIAGFINGNSAPPYDSSSYAFRGIVLAATILKR